MHNKKRVYVLAWQGIGIHAKRDVQQKTRACTSVARNWHTREMRCFAQIACKPQACRELACTRNEMFSKKRVYPAARQGFDLHAKCSNLVKPRVLEKSGGNWHTRGTSSFAKTACIHQAGRVLSYTRNAAN